MKTNYTLSKLKRDFVLLMLLFAVIILFSVEYGIYSVATRETVGSVVFFALFVVIGAALILMGVWVYRQELSKIREEKANDRTDEK